MLCRENPLARVCASRRARARLARVSWAIALLGYVVGRFHMFHPHFCQRALVAAAVVAFTSSAFAGVAPIGEFTGSLSEGFENVAPPAGYPTPLTVFGG